MLDHLLTGPCYLNISPLSSLSGLASQLGLTPWVAVPVIGRPSCSLTHQQYPVDRWHCSCKERQGRHIFSSMDHEILIFSLRAIISYINPARVINLKREDIVHATYRNVLCKLAKADSIEWPCEWQTLFRHLFSNWAINQKTVRAPLI